MNRFYVFLPILIFRRPKPKLTQRCRQWTKMVFFFYSSLYFLYLIILLLFILLYFRGKRETTCPKEHRIGNRLLYYVLYLYYRWVLFFRSIIKYKLKFIILEIIKKKKIHFLVRPHRYTFTMWRFNFSWKRMKKSIRGRKKNSYNNIYRVVRVLRVQ